MRDVAALLLLVLLAATAPARALAPVKVGVAGATGRLGSRIVQQLTTTLPPGSTVVALCSPDGASRVTPHPMVSPTPVDMADEAALAEAMAGCAAAVCALGARESEPLNWRAPYEVDGLMSQRVVAAAERAGVKDFVLVTSLGTGRFGLPASLLNLFWGVLSWKRRTEELLEKSSMNSLIVRPGGMERPTDDYEQTHNMALFGADAKSGGLISRLQVAKLVAAAVASPDVGVTNSIVECIADPSFPKKEPLELLRSAPVSSPPGGWKAKLTPQQYYILREAGTERPFSSPLNNEKRPGVFKCAGCGNELYRTSEKFDSGTGWPSFYAPAGPESVSERMDASIPIMVRTELTCAKCGGHLGHVFNDAPFTPTGMRHCINGLALDFEPEAPPPPPAGVARMEGVAEVSME